MITVLPPSAAAGV
jgi:hypothetical protein